MSNCCSRAGAALALLAIVGASTVATAQDADSTLPTEPAKPTKLFASDSVIAITIASDIKRFMSTRDSITPWLTARLIEGTDTLRVGIRPRGHFRRKTSTCGFPPVAVKFDKEVKGTLFSKQKSLKLVTTCWPGRSDYEAYIPAEYLLYRVYNLITPFSFRARYVTVTYVDTARTDRASIVTRGFFVEDQKDMAARNTGVPIAAKNAGRDDFDQEVLSLLSLFEFMIANPDWSFAAEHNLRFVRTAAFGIAFPVPYDFDFSGTVNARYAVADKELPISRVSERLWMSYCFTPEQLAPAVAAFNAQRPAITALYTGNPLLEPKAAKNTLEYFDEFYKIINDPKQLIKNIKHHCAG